MRALELKVKNVKPRRKPDQTPPDNEAHTPSSESEGGGQKGVRVNHRQGWKLQLAVKMVLNTMILYDLLTTGWLCSAMFAKLPCILWAERQRGRPSNVSQLSAPWNNSILLEKGAQRCKISLYT